MVDSPNLVVAFAAGFVSFVSPCCLPLVPGYLASVSGVAPSQVAVARARVMRRSLLFVATFSVLFVVLGLGATALGTFLFDSQQTLNKLAGGAIVVMGVLFVAGVVAPRFVPTWRPRGLTQRAGNGGPIVAGAAFALAWTPCIGPTLGAILSLSATTAGTARGALLLSAYSAGLAVPFIASAALYDTALRGFGWFRRHYAVVQIASGGMLAVMGVLVFSGELFRLNVEAQRALGNLGLDFWRSI